jgi:cyclic beta-1,2-glucan synthetase
MKDQSAHVVLGFYSAEEGEAEKASQAIASRGGARHFLFSADIVKNPPRALASYAALRLEGEALIAAQAPAPKVPSIVKELRGVGSPAVFVLREDLGRSLDPSPAEGKPDESEKSKRSFLARLRENELALDSARRDLIEAARLGHAGTAAAEWLLDNSYLIRAEIAEIRRHLPRDYPKLLPNLNAFDVARQLVARTDHALNEASISECLRDYQITAPLSIAELWFFPLLLRLALIEALARIASSVSRAQQLREAAYLWANRLAAGVRRSPEVFERMLTLMESEPYALVPGFVTSLTEQLQDEESALGPVQHWIEERLNMPLTEVVRSEHTLEASERVSTANAFGSLRTISRIEFSKIFEAVSLVEAELRRDPSGVYQRSDFATRDASRRVVERIARYGSFSELEVARRAVALAEQAGDSRAGQVSYYLLAEGLAQLEADARTRAPFRIRLIRALRRRAAPIYFSSEIGLTACFIALALALAREAGVHQTGMLVALGALALFPLSELAIQIVNALTISLLPPDLLPKMDFEEGIPLEDATLVVVPMMLSTVEEIADEVEKLEIRFLANRDVNLFFSLFSDFTDCSEPAAPDDAQKLQAARDGISGLNARYPGGRFLLFHRRRCWSETQQMWIGRERKRGKIEDLNTFLATGDNAEILVAGSLPVQIRYVITLDADTQLPPGSGRRMVETIAHPLNRAEIHPAERIRHRGFTIIQPRVSIALPGATATRFTRVFAGSTGTDPYCSSVSDAQQDLFGEAIFHGKAIYDLQAFRDAVGDRFPTEALLSHDLIEGAHVGVALASDIELFENLPLDYASYSKRQHRWIRGDWQIAPWIFSRVPSPRGPEPNPLSPVNRWRILDNLRRSLVPVASLLLLLFGWLISAAPGVWSLVVGLAIAIPAVAPLLDRLARYIQGTVEGWQGAADELVRAVVMIAFLPHQAWLSVDAIARVAYRGLVSRRHLLEWQTAATAAVHSRRHLTSILRQMIVISFVSLVLMAIAHLKHAFGPTSAFLALWVLSPALMEWLSRPAPPPKRDRIDGDDTLFLRRVARKTWRYFDDLVSPESNWLPPDNSQLALRVEVAQRTSPTNIGLWLTSALAAADFGYLTVDDFARRLTQTMETLGRLERYEGHLLNWYDTKSLDPLTPRYVSTVDSGNLLASLWIVAQGCQELLHGPVLSRAALRGLGDTLSILREVCGRDPSIAMPLQALRRLLRGPVEGLELIHRLRIANGPIQQLQGLERWQHPGDDRAYWTSRLVQEVASWTEISDRYLRWMETLTNPPDSFLRPLGEDAAGQRRRALREIPSLLTLAGSGPTELDSILVWRSIPGLRPETAAWLDQLDTEYKQAKANAAATVKLLDQLAAAAARLAAGINMKFVYDEGRRLFGIGYAVGGPREFSSHYDLLASECRLASFVAIAKGDVPVEHWFALGRPRVSSHGRPTLLSWSGTMFEYLMPLLFMRTLANSLLDQACHEALRKQMEYGNENGVPWGFSECAYSALDAHQIYQYRAFGVPGLALKPTLDDDLVVAPYATVLALLVDPGAAIRNLKRLKDLDLDGPMGWFESIDFNIEDKKDGQPGVVIYAYMAHHQGMSLLAVNNALHGQIMQRRLHDDVRVRAMESLLFERIPITRAEAEEEDTELPAIRPASIEEPADRIWREDTAVPRIHLHGNGRYALMVTNSGGGYSRWNEFDLTRWRSDTTLDRWGSFLYIRDLRSSLLWAATFQPLGGPPGTNTARFSADRAEFTRRLYGIETVLDVTVAAEDDAELRRLTVTNRSLRTRQLEFTSYVELALAPHRTDSSHPAFAKMFIETECPESGVLVAHRRERSPEDHPIWAAHMLIGAASEIQYETDRSQFLGRANDTTDPEALHGDLAGSLGMVLDPIFSLRCKVTLEPRQRIELTFITAAAASREALQALVAKYRRPESVGRTFELAWTRAQLEFRYLGIGPAATHRYQELASHLLYPNARLRPPGDRIVRNRIGQSGLWAYGISGDLPMMAMTAADPRDLPLVRELLLAQTYWRLRGFQTDLIILNQESPSYDRPFHQQLVRLIEAHSVVTGVDRPGGVFLRDWYAMPEEHRTLLLSVPAVVISANRGSLQQQLVRGSDNPPPPEFVPAGAVAEVPSPPLPFLELPYFNGLGGFTPDAREYAIYLKPGTSTPAPWVNVMANRGFSAMVTESGLGCTWSGNSQMNRLTPWHNDPVSDPQSEIIYLRDDQSGAVWTPTPLPIREDDAYRARHGQGYTVFEHNSHAIGQELTVFVPVAADGGGDPVKVYRLRLRNDSGRQRRLTVTFFAEWVLGSIREDEQLHILTTFDEASGALLATEYWNGNHPGDTAFAAASPRPASFSGDRRMFLGRNGSVAKPFALQRANLDHRTGPALDPAAALQVPVILDPGQQTDVVFLLGETTNVEAVRALVSRYSSPEQVAQALESTHRWWDSRLGVLQARTPLLSADFMLNRWLPYQALSCRFWARSAMFQSSGAFGFRDQLQDSLAFVHAAPELTRAHILTSAARQFLEGDVQHWWHAETGVGVRTRCSDDLVWLPYVVAHYVETTGDTSILEEEIPFLEGAPLAAGEQERMFIPVVSSQTAPLWEHCRRALDHAWQLGPHSLPLFGNGDWNDGMNRVGVEGRGESTWLAWFLNTVLESFAPFVETRLPAVAASWRERASALAAAMERSGWDGDWYLRGYFDNGSPLGSHLNEEAKIDSLPQSWAVICGAADPDRARRAMESAERYLVREQDHLVCLFTPPFDHSEPHPGYIMGYPPGVRENGGQYTHGSLWLASAWAKMGEGAAAVRLLTMMNPVEHSRNPESVERYRGEPYVAAADVSSAVGKVGRAGWTWYTGSAGWMYRVWIEDVLGFRLRGDRLTITPAIPEEWTGFEIIYRYRSTVYEIDVRRVDATHEPGDGSIRLIDDGGVHKVTVWIAVAQAHGLREVREEIAR